MTSRGMVFFLASVLIALTPWIAVAQLVESYREVTDVRLVRPEPDNWLMYRRTYNGWGYSPLDQVTPHNVKQLVPVWTISSGGWKGHQSPPIVNDGIMFITNHDRVLALDAKTGDVLWLYFRRLSEDVVQLHLTNRGVGLYGDKVYFATIDAHLVALDARTGRVVWEKAVEDYRKGFYMTLAPLVARGKVMVGVSGGELGIRGFVQAFEAETGQALWKTYTVPGPGEPGHDTWAGDSWKTGGAPVWMTGTYDPELNLTYWGTGNAAPWTGDVRPGDNLYANSVVALDVDTGALKAHHQYHWNDSWDWDEVAAQLLIDVKRDDRTIKGLIHPGRNGYLWWLERRQDAIAFVDAKPYVRQNVFTRIDPKTGRPDYDPTRVPSTVQRARFCPSTWGGKNWPPSAYNPKTGYLYIPANDNLCGILEGRKTTYRAGRFYMGLAHSEIQLHEGASHIGELQAWNIHTGQKVWTHRFERENWGPVLTTAGGLVFMGGTHDRYFRAFDAKTGDVLWSFRTNSGVMGVPSAYAIDGVQYLAVQSGWGNDAMKMHRVINGLMGPTSPVPPGGVLWVFALKDV